MSRSFFAKIFLAAVVVLGSAFAVTSSASAQYPAVAASISIVVNINVTPVNTTVTWTCTILDSEGKPLASVPCTTTITDEPGNDAAVGSKFVTKITNVNGQTTGPLHVGSTPGWITLTATYLDLSAQTKVLVTPLDAVSPVFPSPFINNPNQGGLSAVAGLVGLFFTSTANNLSRATTTGGVLPSASAPAAAAPGIRPPSTGDAGLVESQGSNLTLVLAGVAAVSALGVAGVAIKRR